MPQDFESRDAHAVKVRITLDELGQVQRVELVESSSEQLVWNALGSAAGLEFEPARMDGQPVPVMVDFVFRVAPRAPPPPPVVPVKETTPPPTVVESAPTSHLVGTVRDSVTGQPVPEAEVLMLVKDGEPPTTLTDASGRFELRNVPAGRSILAVTATGYVQLSQEEVLPPNETVALELVLDKLRDEEKFSTVVRDVFRRLVSARVGTVSLVTERDLRFAVPQSGNDVIRQVTGLHVRDEEGMGLRLNVGFRGLDPTRSRKTLILEDGVPVTLNPYSEPEAYYTPPIERMGGLSIEKGADTILYGPQTVGGVLNYLTAEPPPRLTVRTEARAGNYGYWMAHVMAGDTVGPIAWRADVAHRSFAGPRRLDLALLDGTLKVRWTPGSGTRVTLKLNVYDEFSRSTYLGLTTPQYNHNWQDNFAIHDSFVLRRYAGTLHVEQKLADAVDFTGMAYAHRIDRTWGRQNFDRYPRDIDYERVVPGRPGAAPRSDGSSIFFHNERIDRARHYTVGGVQAQLSGRIHAGPLKTQLISGVRLHLERADEERVRAIPVTSPSGETIQVENRTGVGLSTWTQLRFTLFERLHFSPGLRIESLSTERDIVRALVPSTVGDLKVGDVQRRKQGQHSALIPGAGVGFDVWDGLFIHAGIHRGWAPPRVKDSLVAIGQNLEVDAELSWNAEVGARLAAGTWLTAEGALFLMDFQNEVVIPSEAGGAAVLIDNATGVPKAYSAPAQHRGLEASATADWGVALHLPFNLSTTLGYTYVDARFTGGAFRGAVVPYAPAHVAIFRTRFESPQGPYAQFASTFVSGQFADNINTPEASVDGTVGELPPYLTMDATAGFRISVVDVFASVKNMEDQRYIVSRAPRGIMPGSPRQALLGVRVEL